MLKDVRRRVTAGLMAFAVVLANVMLPAMPVFADQPGTYQPVWCKLTGSGWKAQLAANGNGKDGALIMTQAILDEDVDAVQSGIAVGAQVYAHDRSDKLDAFCAAQYAPLTIPTPTISPICGLKNDLVTVAENEKYTWTFSGWGVATPAVTFKTVSPYTFTNGSDTAIVPVNESNTNTNCSGTKPDDTYETRQKSSTLCVFGNIGITKTWTEKRVFTYYYNFLTHKWVGFYTPWLIVPGSLQSTEATDEECPPYIATLEAPEKFDFCYNDKDYITIPKTKGITYEVTGGTVSGNSVAYTEGTDVVITAKAKAGYALEEGVQSVWSFTTNDFTSRECLSITKTAKVASDTNKDGKISIGDTITWEITVTNTSGEDLDQVFYVEVEDEGVELENDGYIGLLAAGDSVTLTATSTITLEQAAICKAINTASFSGWREVMRSAERFSIANYDEEEGDDVPLASDNATAEYVWTCTPGQGGGTPETPETPETEIPTTPATPSVAILPNTFGTSTPVVALGALSLAGIILVAGTVIKSRLI